MSRVGSNRRGRRQQQRAGGWLWWCFIPALTLTLLVAAAVQPLQFGPLVVYAGVLHEQGRGWKSALVDVTPARLGSVANIHGQNYLVLGGGKLGLLAAADWACYIHVFRGQRKR